MPFSTIYNLGKAEYPEHKQQSIPSTTTMLVSLFLILLALFIALCKDLGKNPDNSEKVLRSLHKEFGKPEEETMGFGGIIKPQVDTFTLELEKILDKNAKIETTVDGQQVIITAAKNYFYYDDEPNIRPDRQKTVEEMQKILLQWKEAYHPQFKLILGLNNFDLDQKRLANFRRRIPELVMDIGIDPATDNTFKLVVNYE